jgi:cytochrome P450
MIPMFDPSDPALVDDPYPAYAELRRRGGVAYLDDHDVWLVGRYADAATVLREPTVFSSRAGMSADMAPGGPASGVDYRIGASGVRVLIATDPPEHQRFRRAVTGLFTARSVAAMRDGVRAQARTLVARLLSGQATDFYAEVAEPLPTLVFADLFGLPRSLHHTLRSWSDVVTADLAQPPGTRPPIGRGLGMFRHFRRELARAESSTRPSLLRSVAAARNHGLSADEILAFCAFLLVAGIETTTGLLTNLLAVLVARPDLQRRLRAEPELLPSAVEEFIRYDTSVQALWRGTVQPVRLGGHDLPVGARVLVLFGSANRDEEIFADAGRFRPDRDPNPHLGFGAGPHLCLGARLARLEVTVLLEELLAATREITAAGPAVRRPSLILRGMLRQPVRAVAA